LHLRLLKHLSNNQTVKILSDKISKSQRKLNAENKFNIKATRYISFIIKLL